MASTVPDIAVLTADHEFPVEPALADAVGSSGTVWFDELTWVLPTGPLDPLRNFPRRRLHHVVVDHQQLLVQAAFVHKRRVSVHNYCRSVLNRAKLLRYIFHRGLILDIHHITYLVLPL